ncbi:MAG: family 16 glycoside hydrolase [Gemmataceae bacterium]
MYRIAFAIWLVAIAPVLAQTSGHKYALLVAVREYNKNELRSLSYTENDINALAAVLRSNGFKRVVVMTQTAGATQTELLPTTDNIHAQIKGILDCGPNDTVVLGFAGHGVQYAGEDQNYFCPANTKLSDRKTLVPLRDVYSQMKASPALTKLLLADCCRNDPQSDFSRSRQEVKLQSLSRPQSAAPPKGVAALFSCTAGQKAFEDPDLKHGVFFNFVVEGLKGKAANAKGVVTINTLSDYVMTEVRDHVKDKFGPDTVQKPQLLNDSDGAVPLAVVPSVAANRPPATQPPAAGTGVLPRDPSFSPLFNGRDLAGWRTLPEQRGDWRVENGVLIGRGPSISHLFSDRDFGDVHVRAEVRINETGNSGLFLRTKRALTRVQGKAPEGYEGQIIGQQDLGNGVNVTGTLIPPTGPKITDQIVSIRPDEWFTYEFIALGSQLTIKVNGKVTARGQDTTHPRGAVALQVWDSLGTNTVAEFRKIEYKELAPVEPSKTGPAEQVVRPFNGRDFTGWTIDGTNKSGWTVTNGDILAVGTTYAEGNWLLSQRAFANFRIKFDFALLTKGTNSGFCFRARSGDRHLDAIAHVEVQVADDAVSQRDPTGSLYCFNGPPGFVRPDRVASLRPLGSWNTMEVELRGTHLKVVVNGVEVRDTNLDALLPKGTAKNGLTRTSGSIGFQKHSGEIRFRNIEVIDLR